MTRISRLFCISSKSPIQVRYSGRAAFPSSALARGGTEIQPNPTASTTAKKDSDEIELPWPPRDSVTPGFSWPYGGVSGGWGAVQPAHERQQHLGRGWVPCLTTTTLGPAHGHIPLCVG